MSGLPTGPSCPGLAPFPRSLVAGSPRGEAGAWSVGGARFAVAGKLPWTSDLCLDFRKCDLNFKFCARTVWEAPDRENGVPVGERVRAS